MAALEIEFVAPGPFAEFEVRSVMHARKESSTEADRQR